MNVLFIQDEAIRLGGTKILISRLSECFLNAGYEVHILFKTNRASSNVLGIFPPEVKLIFFDPSHRSSLFFPFGLKRSISFLSSEYNFIISFSVDAYFLSLIFAFFYGLKGKNCYYVVNNKSLPLNPFTNLYKEILMLRGQHSFIFMNEECKDGLAQDLNRDFSKSAIIPLPIGERNCRKYQVSGIKKIISIGRIDPRMKTYNWNLLNPLKELKDKGLEFEWHIYGGGENDPIEDLKMKIKESNVGSFVFFHGEVPYSKIETVLSEAYLFVGMGTILIEAAALGIPAVTAIAYSAKPLSNGLLSDLPFGNVGEPSEKITPIDCITIIENMIGLCPEQYWLLRKASHECAKQYFVSQIFRDFCKALDCAEKVISKSYILKSKVAIQSFLGRLKYKFGTKLEH